MTTFFSKRKIWLLLFLFFTFSCAPKVKEIPIAPYQGGLRSFLSEASVYDGLKGVFAVSLKKPGGETLSADALIEIGPGKLKMRFYKLGMPAGQVDGNNMREYAPLKDALRGALLWWLVDGYTAGRAGELLLVRAGEGREIFFDPETFVPIRQTILLPDGLARVVYSGPRPLPDARPVNYPFMIQVEYAGNQVSLKAESVELTGR